MKELRFEKLKYLRYVLVLLLCMLPYTVSIAETGLMLSYDGKTVVYNGKQANVQLDGKILSMNETPGILINGYALVSYQDIFKIGLGADCSVNSTTKMITIEQNNVVVKMILGSTTAYVNGVKTQMPVAPKRVKYNNVNKTKVLVPARFVTEALGYSYSWNSISSIISITSPWKVYYDNSWYIYNGTKGKVTFDNKTIDVSDMPSIIINNTALLQAKKVFQQGLGADYIYDKANNTVTLTKNNNTIIMTLGSRKAIVNNKEYTMDSAARIVKNNANNKSFIMVPGSFVTQYLGYAYSWDKVTKTSVITTKNNSNSDSVKNYVTWTSTVETYDSAVYTNLLKQIKAYKENDNDIISLEGLSAINASISYDKNSSSILIDLPYTYNGIGANSQTIKEGYCIKNIDLISLEATTRLTVKIDEGCEYYTVASGTNFSLYIFRTQEQEYSMQFNKPDEVNYANITTTDLYLSKKFVITIPGNYIDYYTSNPIITTDSVIKKVEVTLNNSGFTNITVTTSKLQGYKLYDMGSYVAIKVGDPVDIYENIVVLDAGHGGTDPGAMYNGYREKDINFSILYQLARKYFNSPDSTIKAYWTRTSDTFITLDNRAAFSKFVGADLFISLHANAISKPSVNGLEIYYSSSNNNTTASGLSSSKLASIMNANLKTDLGLVNHGVGVKTAKYVVVHRNTVPAILIELGFMTNAKDLAFMTDEISQDKTAKSIYNATVDVFNQYPTGR